MKKTVAFLERAAALNLWLTNREICYALHLKMRTLIIYKGMMYKIGVKFRMRRTNNESEFLLVL